MNIREFSRPVKAAKLNESLAKQFGQRINLDEFTLEQLHTARNKLRTQLSQVETNESFSSVQKPAYQKSKLFLDVLNAEIAERELIQDSSLDESVIVEGEEDKAELVMAAKDMVDRVTGWMEDTAEMQTESMLDLADAIRDELGSEQSESFVNTVKPALEQMYSVMEETRAALTNGVGMLTGEGGMEEPMGADMGSDDMEPVDDMDLDTDAAADDVLDSEDDFATDAAAAGGEEEAGREKRESVYRSKKASVNEALDETGTLIQILKTFKPGTSVSWNKLNSYMKKAGVPQFDYNTFKKAYDSNTQLKAMCDFDPQGVNVKDPNKPELDASPSTDGADDVSKMAKRAVDLDSI